MHFVKTEELKTGMRLARPIYNKKSILLFDRNSLLSVQAIESIRNFGLIGVYVLEPAEPLPPMTQEDLEFERFQIKAVSAIEEGYPWWCCPQYPYRSYQAYQVYRYR